MLVSRRKIRKAIAPLGWCTTGHHEGLEQSEVETEMLARDPRVKLSRCPGKLSFTDGTYKDKTLMCICECHGERELPAWQVDKMAQLESAPAPALDADEEDAQLPLEVSTETSETPATDSRIIPASTEEEPGETPGASVDAPVEDGNERPAGEVAEWTSSRTKPMPILGGFIERVRFPSPTKPEIMVVGWVAYDDNMVRLARVWQRQQAKDLLVRGLEAGAPDGLV